VISYRHLWLLCLVACISCEQPQKTTSWEKVEVGNLYSLYLPSYLQPGYDMHSYAGLQYYSLVDKIYVLGIEDSKENLGEIKRKRLKLKGYFAFVEKTVLQPMDTFSRESLQVFQNEDGSTVRVGDYYTNREEFDWNPLYYRISVYENRDYFLQLVIWMPYEEHCNYLSTLDTITQSVEFMEDLIIDD